MVENLEDIDEEASHSVKSTPYHIIISIFIGVAWYIFRYKMPFIAMYGSDFTALILLILVNSYWLMVNTARYHTAGSYNSPDLHCSVSTKHKPITYSGYKILVGGGNDIIPDIPTQNILIIDPLPATQELGKHTKNYLGWCYHKKIEFDEIPTAIRFELQNYKNIPKNHVFIGTYRTASREIVDPDVEFWELQMLQANEVNSILSDVVKDKGLKIEDYLGSTKRVIKNLKESDDKQKGIRGWLNKRSGKGDENEDQ